MTAKPKNPSDLLTSLKALPNWQPSGTPQHAEGDDLFVLINGGAEIYLMPSQTRLGKTPYRGTLPAAIGERVFVVKKRGYQDKTIALAADVVDAKVSTVGDLDMAPG